jgi:transposase
MNRRIAELQKARKWEPLKRLRHKRRHIAEHFDRLDAIKVAKMATAEDAIVAIGYPRRIKYENYRGNGKRHLRRMLQRYFSYGRRIQYVIEECAERGVRAAPIIESETSKRCHRCGSMKTRRPTQSLFWCLNCGLQYNADWNSVINIGSVFFATRLGRRATAGLAYAGDELAQKPASPEAREVTLTPSCQPQ